MSLIYMIMLIMCLRDLSVVKFQSQFKFEVIQVLYSVDYQARSAIF
jgi:hypothetical protein